MSRNRGGSMRGGSVPTIRENAMPAATGELAFLFVQGQYGLLDGFLRDHADDSNGTILADALDAVGGLIFDGGVPPPRVEVNDVGCAGRVEAGAARAQRKQEGVGGAGLEGAHALFAFGRRRGALDKVRSQPGSAADAPDRGSW